ncbi:MAG: HD domain-containing protein [Proteobacteria bacterium]|nr:HD domain-containing protein [Pseudomonadota bacterium]
MKHLESIFQFLKFSEKLKCEERTLLLSSSRPDNIKQESVASHSWQMCMMAMLFEPYLTNKVDLFKTLKMILVHDLVEAEVGDVSLYEVYLNKNIKIQKQKHEQEAIEKIKGMLDNPIGEEIYNLFFEYEKGETHEAKFAKGLDKLEAAVQSLMSEDVSYWGDMYDPIYYKLAYTKCDRFCEHENILKNFNELLKNIAEEEMIKIGIDVVKIKQEIEQEQFSNEEL